MVDGPFPPEQVKDGTEHPEVAHEIKEKTIVEVWPRRVLGQGALPLLKGFHSVAVGFKRLPPRDPSASVKYV